MLRRLLLPAAALSLAIVPACTSDPDTDSPRFEVTLLAGGGSDPVGEEPVTGSGAHLEGVLTSLAAGPDGAVWAVLDGRSLLRVDPGGDVVAFRPDLPDDADEITDVAPAGPDDAFVLLRTAPADPAPSASVFRFAAGQIEPAFGVPANGGSEPATPDGEPAADAELGRVTDIAVDETGEIVFVEQIAGTGYEVVNLVRRVEDGVLRTLAGMPLDGAEITEGEVHAASFPGEGAAATSVPILGPTLVASGASGDVVLQLTRSVLRLDQDGALDHVLGALDGTPEVPRIADTGPLTDALIPGVVGYRSNLRHTVSPAVANDGGALVTTFGGAPTDPDVRERYLWEVTGGTERAQEIADAAAEDESADLAALYVSPEERVVTASLFGTAATMLGDGTVVVAAQDSQTGESILVSFAATVVDTE